MLFALWLKTTLQSDFVVILHVLHFQVQILLSQATRMNPVCSLIENYFAIWLCGDTLCPALSSPDVKLILLSQATHMNPVRSLIENYFAIWLCGDTSCPAFSSPDVQLNFLSQTTHMIIKSYHFNPFGPTTISKQDVLSCIETMIAIQW